MPGSAPAVDYGMVRRSLAHDVEQDGSSVIGHVGSTITNPPIGLYLEDGTSTMAARPWLRPAFEKNKDKIMSLLGAAVEGRDISLGLEDSTLGMGVADVAG